MSKGSDAFAGVVWLAIAALFAVAVVGGGVRLITDPTGQNLFRWIMALLFIGAPLGWLWPRNGAAIRRFFKRDV